MLTGHNTDVKFEGVTYHVQTEDRGHENPVIDTLVYCGGKILHQEKNSYEDALGGSPAEDEKAVAERLDRQHRDFVRRVRHGEFAEQQVTLGGVLEAGGTLLDTLERFLLTDHEVEGLSLQWKAKDGSLSGCLVVAHFGENAERVVGARVTARLVARGLAPVTVFEGETNEHGRIVLKIPPPPGPATAIIFAAEKDTWSGRLRVSLPAGGGLSPGGSAASAGSRVPESSS